MSLIGPRRRARSGAKRFLPRLESLEERKLLSYPALTPFPTGASPQGVAVGYFNGDGKLDLAVATANGVSILLGNGDGTFAAPKVYDPGAALNGVVVADFNGDGKPDLAVLSPGNAAQSVTGTVSVLLGNGNGTFRLWSVTPAGMGPFDPVVGDFNKDGKPDLVFLTSSSPQLLLGNGDGTFQPSISLTEEGTPTGVAVGDLNGDGNPDLAFCGSNLFGNGYTSTGVTVLPGNGDGTFGPPQIFSAQGSPNTLPSAIAIADLNGDGKPDLIVGNLPTVSGSGNGGSTLPLASLDVYLSGGRESLFQNPFSVGTSSAGFSSLTVADINADGIPDILAVNTFAPGAPGTGSFLSLYEGNGNATFQNPVTVSLDLNAAPLGPVVGGDFNGDGRLDLAVADAAQPQVDVFLDQEPSLVFSQTAFYVAADSGNAVITVTPSGPTPPGPVTVHYMASGGTAVAGADYLPVSGTLTFNRGAGSQSFLVPILDHVPVASGVLNPTIDLTLSDFSGGDVPTPGSSAVLTITEATDSTEFVSGTVHDLLGRPSTPADLAGPVGPLELAAARARVLAAQNLLAGQERDNMLINGYYVRDLHHVAAQADLAYWVGLLQAGATDEAVQAGIVGSREYLDLNLGNNPDPDTAFLQAVYPDVLRRPLDSAGLALWLPLLQGGMSRASVALAILGGVERQGLLVQDDYQSFLGRLPGANDQAFWLGMFAQGQTDEQVQAGIAGSAEAFHHFGNAAAGWVEGMFATVLQRPPDPAGLTAFVNFMLDGQAPARQAPALAILTGTQYRDDLVAGYYQKYLGRAAGTRDVAFWVGMLQAGQTDEQVLAGIVGSDEYLNLHRSNDPILNLAFLEAAYPDLLGRPLDDAGKMYWLPLLQQGATRADVALSMMHSTEYRDRLVSGWVQTYLGRPAVAADLAPLLTVLAGGATDEEALAQLLAGNEYFQKPHLYP